MHDSDGNVVASDCGVQLKIVTEATDETSFTAEELGLLSKSEAVIKSMAVAGGAADPKGAAGKTYYFGSSTNVPATFFRKEWLVSSSCPRVCLLPQWSPTI